MEGINKQDVAPEIIANTLRGDPKPGDASFYGEGNSIVAKKVRSFEGDPKSEDEKFYGDNVVMKVGPIETGSDN